MNVISLGSNCHPAHWLKKTGVQNVSYPFDWLLSPSHLGLSYCIENLENRFSTFLDRVTMNARGHCVSEHFPSTELFHHAHLLAPDEQVRIDERTKLEKRAERLLESISAENTLFIYCYSRDLRPPTREQLATFEDSVFRLLGLYPSASLLVYFMRNDAEPDIPFDASHERLIVKNYIRDTSVDKVWGTAPEFIEALAK